MELVGDFRSMDPIFKGCYSDSLLYTNIELGQLRWHGIHLPPYWSEILALPAPSYLQARQPKVMKQSPPRATSPTPSVESLKAKHCSSGCSSITSTPKHPDSTSAKKPSSSKESTSNKQEKSSRVCSSCKHGHSPSPSATSVRCKWKEVHTEDTHALNSTLPISPSALGSLHSPMGFHSDVAELLPPSITLTPLGLGGPRQWRTTSDESRHLLTSIYTSSGFNIPGYPAAGPGKPYSHCPQPQRIPPCVEYLAHQQVHLWAILSPPDYQPGQQPVQAGH